MLRPKAATRQESKTHHQKEAQASLLPWCNDLRKLMRPTLEY